MQLVVKKTAELVDFWFQNLQYLNETRLENILVLNQDYYTH